MRCSGNINQLSETNLVIDMKIKFFMLGIVALLISACASDRVYSPLTEPLEDSAWDVSKWISVVDVPVVTGRIVDGSRAADGASWFVGTVRNDKKVASARWMTAGLGVYDLYINGELVGEEVLKPGFTHNFKTKYSFTYDITSALSRAKGAENVFSAQVTPGWWGDKIVTPWGSDGMHGTKCAFRGVVELTYTDGTKQLFGTDTENWKAGVAIR